LSARVTLGRALLELGDLNQAQRELETVRKAAPDNLAAVRGIADIHYKRGALPEALEFYRTALGLAKNDPELEQIVADLSQRLEPKKRADSSDGLSLEQMQREMTARVPAPDAARTPAPAPPLALRLDAVRGARAETRVPGRDRAVRTIAALEQWLAALHVARAHPAT
jgi:tetratricopeptide (TPR) repeat protein